MALILQLDGLVVAGPVYMPSRPVLQGQKFWNYMVSKLDAQILFE